MIEVIDDSDDDDKVLLVVIRCMIDKKEKTYGIVRSIISMYISCCKIVAKKLPV